MTEKEIWSLATAGDGSLDPALAKAAGLPLEEFQAEKQRRIEQAAADRDQQQALNRSRSIGSLKTEDAADLGDPTAEARQYLERMETAYQESPAEQLEGQAVFPGFEQEEEPAPPAPLDAETVKKNIARVSFKIDYLRSPEDAIMYHGEQLPPGAMKAYQRKHFSDLVQIAAEETGADPEQIADKARRTPEQDRLLTEIAGRMQIARFDAFFSSRYVNALAVLDPVQGEFERITRSSEPAAGQAEAQETAFSEIGPFDYIKAQAVLYFFATHEELKPTEAGKLTEAQEKELRQIFGKLDSFYVEKDIDGAALNELQYIFTGLFSEFIERENPAKGAAEKIFAELNLLQSISPAAHTMPNNALMNALQNKGIIEAPETAQGWDLIVAHQKGRRKEITAFTMVTYDPGETGVTVTGANLTEYERQVSDALISLWIAADRESLPPVFTPDMVYRSMPGGSEKASPQQKGAITRTIEKFRRLHVKIDATEEMRKRGLIGPTATYKQDAFYISATHAEYKAKNGGQLVNAYKVETEPIILTYAKMTNQLLTVPSKYLAIEKVKSNPRTGELETSGELVTMTADRQAMTGYLLRRIAVMKHDKKNKVQTQSDTILFATLFRETGTETDNRKQAMNNRKFCFEVLDYWKAAGYIKDYLQQGKGRSITGVQIVL